MESEDYFFASLMFFAWFMVTLIVGSIGYFTHVSMELGFLGWGPRNIADVIRFLSQWIDMYPFLFTSIGFLLFGIEQKEKEGKKLQEEKNLRWVLIISLFMFYISLLLFPSYRLPESKRYLSVFSWVSLAVTITSSALFTAGYGKKELVYKISIYSFIIATIVFLVSYILILFYA